MSNPTPPPLPDQPADEAARAAQPPSAATAPEPTRPAYDPATDPDDTGVPQSLTDDAQEVGRGFMRALFDLSFRTFITRRLASVFYLVGLIAIGIGFLVYFIGGILNGVSALWYNPGGGIALIVATVVLVPIATLLLIIALRFVIEGVVALIAIAENTERTAEHTRR
ncbi:hypothetical protein GCM10022200_12190 [Microbacterium awajiense]|uniref:DUF4282 domain-containing protein n=1 Tax=Microbacterium awajiense TaxID=415214 RepID=A0ABP7AET0_9MICO